MSSFSSHFLLSAAFRGAALIGGRRLLEGGAYIEIRVLGAALIRGRRLIEGGAYWRAALIGGNTVFTLFSTLMDLI